ncbi:hypothetical protein Salat_1236200 [Sesamum alatum]|uniref:Uncharacterized protein n=1 Tax=Sesamum alatum TaxID=300844 RepID=A0AAE1YGV9_9LAMI|nr:hypothetical protein Salat_1236200 [Sesamum alatum]
MTGFFPPPLMLLRPSSWVFDCIFGPTSFWAERVIKEAGLVDDEFNAKKILEDELLIVAGLYPAPDRYERPLDRLTRFRIMMNRAAVPKFISDDVPAMPSSWGIRSAPSTPSDLAPELTPTPTTTPPPSSVPCPQDTPVIEVVTSPEDIPSMIPPTDLPQDVHPSSPLPLSVEDLPSSHKRPRVEAEGAFNMSKTVNRADVKVLTPRPFTSIGNLILSNASVITAAVTALVEKYSYALRTAEALRRELQEAKAGVRAQCAEIEAQTRERENNLKEELDILKNQMVEKENQLAVMTMENAAIKASTMQAYARGREEGASSAISAFKRSSKYADEMYRQASAYYVDGFATCLAQFKNIGNLPHGFDLSFVNVRANGYGNTDVGPSS